MIIPKLSLPAVMGAVADNERKIRMVIPEPGLLLPTKGR